MMSEIFQSPKNIPNNAILSALLTAFQAMSEDLTKKPTTCVPEVDPTGLRSECSTDSPSDQGRAEWQHSVACEVNP
jgi:hypothetical protein